MAEIERTEFNIAPSARTPASQRIDGSSPIEPTAQSEDNDIESGLRPKSLSEFIGQPKVRNQLDLVLTGAKRRGVVPDHVLLSGPPGLGKTTMAMIIAQELGSSLRMTSAVGPMKIIWHCSHKAANRSFSDKNPNPGWIASAPDTMVALMICSIFR